MSNQQESREVRVGPSMQTKQIQFLIKQSLLTNEKVDVISGTQSAPASTRSLENLARLGYIVYTDVKTDTSIINNSRRTSLIVTVSKGKDFDKLYAENEEKRKKFQEEREKTTNV
jgi:hypothetical protein